MKQYHKDYYKILQVDPAADQEIIRFVYKRLSHLYHPDINLSHEAELKMREINEAYHVLSNPQERTVYDVWYHEVYRNGENTRARYQRQERSYSGKNRQDQEDFRYYQTTSQKRTASHTHTAREAPGREPENFPHRSRLFPKKSGKRIVSKSIKLLLLVIILIVLGFLIQSYITIPVSCSFQDGIVFSDRLCLTNTSQETFYNVTVKMNVNDKEYTRFFLTWFPQEKKRTLLVLDTVPRTILLDFRSDKKKFSRYCFLKRI